MHGVHVLLCPKRFQVRGDMARLGNKVVSPRSPTARASSGRAEQIVVYAPASALPAVGQEEARRGLPRGPLINTVRPKERAHHPLSCLQPYSTAATLMLLGGIPVKVDLERLGHSNMRITLSIYVHVLPSM